MGKFSNKDLPSFLKKPNYYSEDEQFDGETGRNPEVTEDCETCGQEPQIAENKVLRFADFLNEKKQINAGLQAYLDKKAGKKPAGKKAAAGGKSGKPDFLDLDKDGDKKESMKKAATDAKSGASKKKTVAIKEGAMSEIDLLAQEAKTFRSFVRAFKKEYSNLDAGDNKELESWLQTVYDSAKSRTNESWDPSDAYEYGATSNCCGASVMMGDICSDCGEHCEAEYWDEEGDGENPEEFGSSTSYNEGHTCHDGSKSMLSEAAHHLIESICESTCSDASMYEADSDPEHQFEGYVTEACAYMEKCMYEMVDDGMTINEGWNNESACYESTCEMIKEVCEKLCSEALEIHNDQTPTEYNEYVAEAIGCYKNGLMECAMSESDHMDVNESEESADAIYSKVAQWIADANNQERSLSMSKEQQAAEIRVTPQQYEKAIKQIKKEI
jgi:hypothetical protein